MYKITNLITGEVKEIEDDIDLYNAILILFSMEACLSKTEGDYEIWSAIYHKEYFRVEKVKDVELIVTLTFEEILKITERMCKGDERMRNHVGIAWLEYLIFEAIRHVKKVDFLTESQNRKEKINES